MIQTKINLKLQGSRSVVDSPLYIYQDTKNLHLILNLINNKYDFANGHVSYTIIKPNGDVEDKTDCFIKRGDVHLILDGDNFHVGQNLIQVKLYDSKLHSIVALPPFALHLLDANGDILVGEYEDALLSEDELKMLSENELALHMDRNVKISDLPTTDIMQGYVPVVQGDETYKFDLSNVEVDLSDYAPKEHEHSYNDLTDKPTIPNLDGLAKTEDVNLALQGKADVDHNHDGSYVTNTRFETVLNNINNKFASKSYVDNLVGDIETLLGEI